MKSIKEKAEESSLGYDEVQAPAIGRGFVLGANYVLDEIEKILSRANMYKDGSDHTILYLDIEFLVKQLKK